MKDFLKFVFVIGGMASLFASTYFALLLFEVIPNKTILKPIEIIITSLLFFVITGIYVSGIVSFYRQNKI